MKKTPDDNSVELSPKRRCTSLSFARFKKLLLRACSTILLSSAVVLILSGSTTAERAAGDWGKSIQAYQEGNIQTAINQLVAIGSSSDIQLVDRLNARFYLTEICSEIVDYACLANNNAALEALLAMETDSNAHEAARLQIAVSEVEQVVWDGNVARLDVPTIMNSLNHVPFGQFYPDKYLTLQTSEIDYAIENGDYANARRAIARLIARAVVLPDGGDYILPSYLAEIVMGLYGAGDRFHSLLYAAKFDNFIRAGLPRSSPTLVRYLELTTELEANIGTPVALDEGVRRLDAADTILAHIHGSGPLLEIALATTNYQRAELAFLNGSPEKAREVLSKSPIERKRQEIQKSGKFASEAEFNFALVDLFLSRTEHSVLDQNWKPLLSAKPFWERGQKLDEYFELERNFGLALLDSANQPELAHELGAKAAFADVHRFEESLFGESRSFPVANFVDRFIIGLELAELSKKKILTRDEQDFVVKAVTILQRNIYHFRGDTLLLLSNLKTEKDRRIAHTRLLLMDRRDELELKSLERRVARAFEIAKKGGGNSASPNGTTKELAAARGALIDLGDKVDELSTLPDEPNGKLNSLPGSTDLRSILRPEERIVVEAPLYGTVFRLCVGPQNQFEFNRVPLPQTLLQDARLLRASLSATYAPQPLLDAQYPAEAAVRLAQFTLGGFGACLQKDNRVFYSPIIDLVGIPPSALLESVPPQAAGGYALGDATWLVRKFEFANISSVEEFAAARRLAANAGAELSFLGVGDPVLARSIDGKSTGGQLLASRGVRTADGTISSLPELPDTSIELHDVASGFTGSHLLVRDDATRRRFLVEPLGHFDIVEFATHALITGDLSGISEPGLVLTPTTKSDREPFDDGFLSATEISGLILKARLVVLSACNTANFEVDNFYGNIRGLSESLAMSGVPTVLASLWPVDSATSRRLITSFFNELKRTKGTTISGAFAAATRHFLDTAPISSYLHPRFWAPFAVFGDGGEPGQQISEPGRARLIQFYVGSDAGEVLGLTRPSGSADLFDSRIGEWNGKRYASLVEMRNPSGVVQWAVKNQTIGAGKIVSNGSQVFVDGYTSSPDGARTTPVLRSFDLKGNLLWQKVLEDGASQSVVTDLVYSDTGILWTIVKTSPNSGQPDEAITLDIQTFDSSGHALKRWAIALPNHSSVWRSPTIALSDRGAYVFSPTLADVKSSTTDDFGQIRACPSGEGTEIFEATNDQPTLIRRGYESGVVVLRAKRIGSTTYVVGIKLQQCSYSGEPFLGQLNESDPTKASYRQVDGANVLQELYVEKGILGGEFLDFTKQDGTLILAGNMETRTKEMVFAGPTSFDPRSQLNVSEYQREDSFLVEFDLMHPKGSAAVHFFNAGADTAIESIDSHAGIMTLAGNVGFRPLWARYTLH